MEAVSPSVPTSGDVPGCAGKPSLPLPSATRSVACFLNMDGQGSLLYRSLGYMDAQRNLRCLSRAPPGALLALLGTWIVGKPPMPLSSATDSVACSLEYTDTQGSRLCLSRASQGPLLALWGTVVRRVTFYADLSEVHRCSGKPSICRPLERLTSISGYMDPQGNLLCISRAPQGPLLLWGTWMRRETFYASLERHRVRCLLSGIHGSAGKPSMPISEVDGI